MQWFLQVVRENDPHDGQSGAVTHPDWWVGDMIFGRFFSDGTGVLSLVMVIAEPFPVPPNFPKGPVSAFLRAPKCRHQPDPVQRSLHVLQELFLFDISLLENREQCTLAISGWFGTVTSRRVSGYRR